jgi:hypothetical protein
MSISLFIAGVGNNIPDLDTRPDPVQTATKPTSPQQSHAQATTSHAVDEVSTTPGTSQAEVGSDLSTRAVPAATPSKPTLAQQLHSLVTTGHSVTQIATTLGLSEEQVNTALGILSASSAAAFTSTRLSVTA